MGLGDDLDEAAGVRAAGDDAVGAGGDGGTHGLLVGGHVAAVEGGVDVVAGVVGPLLGTVEEVRPDRVGRSTVRDPEEGLFSSCAAAASGSAATSRRCLR